MSHSLMKLSGWFCEPDQPIYWTELTFMSFDNVWSLKTVVPFDGTCMEKSFIQYSSFRLNKKKDKDFEWHEDKYAMTKTCLLYIAHTQMIRWIITWSALQYVCRFKIGHNKGPVFKYPWWISILCNHSITVSQKDMCWDTGQIVLPKWRNICLSAGENTSLLH